MRWRRMQAAALLGAVLLAAVSCLRSEVRTAVIEVPQMSDARSLRIVTNAALDEIVGCYDGTKNQMEIDLTNRRVIYHESPRLFSPEYQRRMLARLAEVGFKAQVVKVWPDPPPPVPTTSGPVQIWPDRITAVLSVPDLASITEANIVADAIAYARLGGEDPRVVADGEARRLLVTFSARQLSLKNIEQAIACVGYAANDVPARKGADADLPHGWSPVSL